MPPQIVLSGTHDINSPPRETGIIKTCIVERFNSVNFVAKSVGTRRNKRFLGVVQLAAEKDSIRKLNRLIP